MEIFTLVFIFKFFFPTEPTPSYVMFVFGYYLIYISI